jgi:TRAP-type C4-dicarboxylate transport system permease small subunit
VFKNIAGEFSNNKTLAIGIIFLAVSLFLSLLSMYPEYRPLGVPAAILAIFGALMAIRGYLSFLERLKAQQSS